LLEGGSVVPACLAASFRIFFEKNADPLSGKDLILAKNMVALFTTAEVSMEFGQFQGG
jgi:hypothetical protein